MNGIGFEILARTPVPQLPKTITQNIDCGYSLEPPWRGGSNEYPQSVFLNRHKKNNVYPIKPPFYYIKVGFKGVKIIKVCFRNVQAWQSERLVM